MDKSRSSSRTETKDTVKTLNKTRSISSDSLYDKDTPKKFRNYKLRSNTPSVSSISIHGESITNISTDKDSIPCKD